MQNESLDMAVGAIIDEEMGKYKKRLIEEILKHLGSPYCASTDIGKVMYEKEIVDIINKTN